MVTNKDADYELIVRLDDPAIRGYFLHVRHDICPKPYGVAWLIRAKLYDSLPDRFISALGSIHPFKWVKEHTGEWSMLWTGIRKLTND